jgi:hypothetical protein
MNASPSNAAITALGFILSSVVPWQVGFQSCCCPTSGLPFYYETDRPTFPTSRQLRAELSQEMMMCATAA